MQETNSNKCGGRAGKSTAEIWLGATNKSSHSCAASRRNGVELDGHRAAASRVGTDSVERTGMDHVYLSLRPLQIYFRRVNEFYLKGLLTSKDSPPQSEYDCQTTHVPKYMPWMLYVRGIADPLGRLLISIFHLLSHSRSRQTFRISTQNSAQHCYQKSPPSP